MAGTDASLVWAAHSGKVAHVEIVGTLATGQTELVQVGSGFRVAQPYVVTSAHLFEGVENYSAIKINVRFVSRDSSPYVAHLQIKDPKADLALLRVEGMPKENGCPLYMATGGNALIPGADVYFLGFPIDGPLRISGGMLSIAPDPTLDLWQTDALLNPGNSGGPGFIAGGYLVGVAKGALTEWQSQGLTTKLQGVAQFVPALRLQNGVIGKKLEEDINYSCLKALRIRQDGSFGLSGGPPPSIDLPSPFTLARPVTAEWAAQDLQPRQRSFKPDDGYKVRQCWFEPTVVKGVKVDCSTVEGGRYARVDFTPVKEAGSDIRRQVLGQVVIDQAPSQP